MPVNISKTEVNGFFASTNDCPGTLRAGASCTFTVTFTPSFVGPTGGEVRVTDDALPVVQTSVLEGGASSFHLATEKLAQDDFTHEYHRAIAAGVLPTP